MWGFWANLLHQLFFFSHLNVAAIFPNCSQRIVLLSRVTSEWTSSVRWPSFSAAILSNKWPEISKLKGCVMLQHTLFLCESYDRTELAWSGPFRHARRVSWCQPETLLSVASVCKNQIFFLSTTSCSQRRQTGSLSGCVQRILTSPHSLSFAL